MAITVELTERERRLIVASLNRSRNRAVALAKGDVRKEELVKNQYNEIRDKFKIND